MAIAAESETSLYSQRELPAANIEQDSTRAEDYLDSFSWSYRSLGAESADKDEPERYEEAYEQVADMLSHISAEYDAVVSESEKSLEASLADYAVSDLDLDREHAEEAYDDLIAAYEPAVEGIEEDAVGDYDFEDLDRIGIAASDDIYQPEQWEVYDLLEPDEKEGYLPVRVVKTSLPDGFHGFTFTNPGSDPVVFVNDALYDFDEERTTVHEIWHKEHPHHSEEQTRLNTNTLGVRPTLSYRGANTPARYTAAH